MNNQKAIDWCKNNLIGITDCKITSDGKLVVYGNIIIDDNIKELPVKIDEVFGSVVLDNAKEKRFGKFKSLRNMPTVVHGKFDCSLNKGITSLEGGPEIVEGSYFCTNCNLTSLKGIAKRITGSLLAFNNNISNIDEIKTIKLYGDCDFDHNLISI